MDIALLIIGLLFMIVGILGSFLPVLPGPPLSWVGLLLLYLTKVVPDDWVFLVITFIISIGITILDYVIPAAGTKKFGGTKAGVWGSIIGLIVGVFLPIPGGIIIGAFLGALIGELTQNVDRKKALKAAFGSFLGFLTGTFLKFLVTILFAGWYIWKAVVYSPDFFSFS